MAWSSLSLSLSLFARALSLSFYLSIYLALALALPLSLSLSRASLSRSPRLARPQPQGGCRRLQYMGGSLDACSTISNNTCIHAILRFVCVSMLRVLLTDRPAPIVFACRTP